MAALPKVGDRIDQTMVVGKKVKRDFTNGTFLLFQLNNRDGVLKAVYWDPTPEAEHEIVANDVVAVRGEITEYQGALQLKIARMEKLDPGSFDPAEFLPSSTRDTAGIYDELLAMIGRMENAHIRGLLTTIFGDEGFRAGFEKAPAAKGWHHSYVGGLAEHVYDMARLALAAAEVYPEADRDLLLAGVLLPDLGKLEELFATNRIDYTDKGRLVGHIALGAAFLDEFLRGMTDFPEELALRLRHMVLSHHGSRENGSPVVPMTVEALLLNYVDNMDAQVRGALMTIEKNSGDGRWTEYVRLLDRFIYRGADPGETNGE